MNVGLRKKSSVLMDVPPEASVFMGRDQEKSDTPEPQWLRRIVKRKWKLLFDLKDIPIQPSLIWVEGCPVAVLEEGDWVILDKGAFHKSPQTRKAHTFSFFLLTHLILTTLNTNGQPSKPELERTNINPPASWKISIGTLHKCKKITSNSYR